MNEVSINSKFSMRGSPHRPLQLVEHSSHLRGLVASTGNSPLVKVMAGLELNGGHGYASPKAEHWAELQVKYHKELDDLFWVKTGKHLPVPGQPKPKISRGTRAPRGPRVKIDVAELIALLK